MQQHPHARGTEEGEHQVQRRVHGAAHRDDAEGRELDINSDAFRQGFWKHFPLAALVGVAIALEMALVLTRGFDTTVATPLTEAAAKVGNTKLLGIDLYTNYRGKCFQKPWRKASLLMSSIMTTKRKSTITAPT